MFDFLKSFFERYRERSRKNRAKIFRKNFHIDRSTKILDLGSSTGSNINLALIGTEADPSNVYLSDIDTNALHEGCRRYGFMMCILKQSDSLPFPDKYFDIVFCSSVIEHITLPKEQIWSELSTNHFSKESLKIQKRFADEIKRISKRYFVQTPNKYFPIESHTWLPFASLLPRRLLIPLLRITNRFWIKATSPDWNLLTKRDFRQLFDDALIIEEKKFGLVKSIIAIK